MIITNQHRIMFECRKTLDRVRKLPKKVAQPGDYAELEIRMTNFLRDNKARWECIPAQAHGMVSKILMSLPL